VEDVVLTMTQKDLLSMGYVSDGNGGYYKPSKNFGQGGPGAVNTAVVKAKQSSPRPRVCGDSPDLIVGSGFVTLLTEKPVEAAMNLQNENPENNPARVRAVQSQSDERLSLDHADTGEETCWYDAATRFEIRFIVYSRRPCDWDGYDIKALQDFCCKTGAIPNDGWRTLSGRVLSQKAATEGEERTEIEITALT
jgi:hypothetical protein